MEPGSPQRLAALPAARDRFGSRYSAIMRPAAGHRVRGTDGGSGGLSASRSTAPARAASAGTAAASGPASVSTRS